MYLKQLVLDRQDLDKALAEIRHNGQRLAAPDYRIDSEYVNDRYPGRSFLAVYFPPSNLVRTQFFKELAKVVGLDEGIRLAQRSRTEETESDMVIFFPDVTLTGSPVSA